MKAIILCEENLEDIYDKTIFSVFNEKDVVIVVTENSLYQDIKTKYPSWKCESIYIYGDSEFKDSKDLAHNIIDEVKRNIHNLALCEISEISINSVYEIYTRVLYQTKINIDLLVKKYGINRIHLFGGNRKVPYFPLNMAEGERPFRFMYKRRWFLNPLIYDLYNKTNMIEWAQESSIKLRVIRYVRRLLMNGGKICKTMLKYLKSQKRSFKVLDGGEYIGIIVRTRNQVASINSIYHAIEKNTRFKPVLLLYENYSNNDLIDDVNKANLDYVDVRCFANIWRLIKNYFRIKFTLNEGKSKALLYFNQPFDNKLFTREMSFQWWDALLLEESMTAALIQAGINLKSIVNVETYNWVAAIQAKWAHAEGLPIYSVQFVTLDLRPKMVWADKYFFMSKIECNKFESVIEKEKCGYVGPVCYDNIYGKSCHKQGILHTILILTQPDSLREDSIKIIDDILHIRAEMGSLWKICIKLHPRENNKSYFHERYKSYDFVTIIFNEANSTELLINSDLAIGIVSTTLYQSVIIGTPAISINYNGLTNYLLDVVESGCVKKITNYDEMKNYLENFDMEENNYYTMRMGYLENSLGNYKGKGAEEFAKYINETI